MFTSSNTAAARQSANSPRVVCNGVPCSPDTARTDEAAKHESIAQAVLATKRCAGRVRT